MKKIIKYFALPLSLAIIPGLSLQTAQATVKPMNLAADPGTSQGGGKGDWGGYGGGGQSGGDKGDWGGSGGKDHDWKGSGKGDWGGSGGKDHDWKGSGKGDWGGYGGKDHDWKGSGKGDWGGYGGKDHDWKGSGKGDWGGYGGKGDWKGKHGKSCKYITEQKWMCHKESTKKCSWENGKYTCKTSYCEGGSCPKKCGWYPVEYKVCSWN